MKIPATNPLYVFDLDGVITHPQDSSVDARAVKSIRRLLDQGHYVAVNTGRSYQWVESHLLSAFNNAPQLFDHLCIACEKGGESIEWHNSQFVPQPSRFALADDIHTKVREFFESHASQFPTMFWDATKMTMATIEKYPRADLGQFRSEQNKLVAHLQNLLAAQEVRIDPTTIATDVESPLAGKHAGAELIHEWIASHAVTNPKHYVSFGDSKSDYEMARYFADSGDQSTFVFVGSKHEVFNEHADVTLVRTSAEYAAGTNEYFSLIS